MARIIIVILSLFGFIHTGLGMQGANYSEALEVVQQLMETPSNLEESANAFINFLDTSVSDLALCYNQLDTFFKELMNNKATSLDQIMHLTNIGDYFIHSSNKNNAAEECLALLGDDIMQFSIQHFNNDLPKWRCNFYCKCSYDSKTADVVQILIKNGYGLAITPPDKVKICREIRAFRFGYLFEKFNTRCMNDCLRHGRCSSYCFGTFISIVIAIMVFGYFFQQLTRKR